LDGSAQLTRWSTNLRLGGQYIGWCSGGTGTTPLVANLGTNGSISTIQLLLRSLRYWSVSDNPREAQRVIKVVATDASGHTSTAARKRIDVHRVNDPPSISFSPQANTAQDGLILIDPGATVSDPDSTSFDGGTLTLECIANGVPTDRWGIRNEGSNSGQIG